MRFDGRNFLTFNSANIAGLKSDRIPYIVNDTIGNIYALSDNRQMIRFTTSKNHLAPLPTLTKKIEVELAQSGYATTNVAVSDLWNKIRNKQQPDENLMVCTRQEDIYLSKKSNLYFIRGNNCRLISDSEKWAAKNHIAVMDSLYLQVMPGNHARAWYGGKLIPTITAINGAAASDTNFLGGRFSFFWCGSGTFLYAGRTIYRLTASNGSISSYTVFENLDVEGLCSFAYLKEANKYFLGSTTKGLYVLEPTSFKYPEMPDGANKGSVYAQIGVGNSKVFSSDLLFSSNGSYQNLPIGSKRTMGYYLSADSQLYYDKGYYLCRYNFVTGGSDSIVSLNGRLQAIIPDHTGKRVFFCTQSSIGVLTDGNLTSLKQFPAGNNVKSIQYLAGDDFLLFTKTGLKWYNLASNSVNKTILDSVNIWNTYQDEGGSLWISSYGKGFFLYDSGKVHPFPYGPRQSLKTVHSFIDDGAGYFWLPTNNGLFKVSRQNLLDYAYGKITNIFFYMFDKQNGLRTNEFNGGASPSYLWLSDSMLSLPSLEGFVWFNPYTILLTYPDKQIYFQHVKVDGQDADIVAGNYRLRLKPDFSNLSLLVSSPYFGNADNIKLEYTIEGMGASWLPVPDNGRITIARMQYGSYELKVRKRTEKGYDYLSLPIEVRPYFYNTWWFYLLVLVLAVALVWLLFKRRLKALRNKSEELERQVAARTAQLESSQHALAKSNKVKDTVITMVLHDLRSPLSFLHGITNHLASKYQQMDGDVLGRMLTDLKTSSAAIQQFTEQFFAWAGSQHEGFMVNNTSFKLNDLFDETEQLYADILKTNGNSLVVKPTGLSIYTDYPILCVVLRNLVDNANKNTRNGTITMQADMEKTDIIITISDTGKGLTDEQVAYYINTSKGMAVEGKGSSIILQMLPKISASLAITTAVGKGSSFMVRINSRQADETAGQDSQGQ